MHFKVSSMNKANDFIKKYGAAYLISLNDFGSRTFQSRLPRENHLTVHFDDEEDYQVVYAPTLQDIERILHFGTMIPDDATVIVNCHAGMCRSTSVALGLATQRYGIDRLDEFATAMLEQRPQSCPNRLVAHLMDVALGTDGQLFKLACDISDKHRISAFRSASQGYVLPPKE